MGSLSNSVTASSKAVLVLTLPLILVSFGFTVLLNLINISQDVLPAFRHFEDPDRLVQRRAEYARTAPGGTLDHLMWFLQISDLHVSEFVDKRRISQLEEFCMDTVATIKPALVIASGDLTDAMDRADIKTEQREWEWTQYSRILRETNVTARTVWLDIRGNHDAFNVPSPDSNLNYYKTHSQRGSGSSKHYHYVHSFGTDRISFIGIDACPDPGFKRPFSFFGVLTDADLKQISMLERESHESNVTVWFGHYPTSVISSAAPGIAGIMRGGVAYLSGHLHTGYGFVPEMYAMQKSGTLELELGDWKDNRLFRLLAVDHDLLSFTDVHFNDWPVGLITNPKNLQFYAPVHEPLDRISRSTHVRVLAFSPAGIKSVEIQLPDATGLQSASSVGDCQERLPDATDAPSPSAVLGDCALYVLPWDPSRYAVGDYSIRAKITDNDGRVRDIIQKFATRRTEVPAFGFLRRLVLMLDVSRLCGALTYGVASANLLVLLLFGTGAIRWIYAKMVGQFGRGILQWSVIVQQLHAVLSLSWVFWPLLVNTVSVMLMPWFYGEIVDGSFGVVFTLGIWLNGRWLDGQVTYKFAATHLIRHCMPLLIATTMYVRSRIKHAQWNKAHIFYHLTYCYLVVSQIKNLRMFTDCYGWISGLTNWLVLWSGLVPTIFLWCKAWTMGKPGMDSKTLF